MSVLSDKIKNELIKLSKSDKHLQSIIKKLESGNATFADVDAFTQATGAVLKKAFEKSIVESPKSFVEEEMLTEILGDIFGDNYELINSVAENVQKQLDKAAGIGIKPQRADFPSERIENLAKITAQKDLTDKAALSEFTASVENINGSIFTDYIRANADFRSKAGLQVYVIRTDHSGCCEWCAKLAGKYVYPNVPKDVWRRHKRCSCEIIYVNERAGTYDRISFNDKADGSKITTTKQVMRLTPEQAFAKEKEVLKKLDKTAESGIIKSVVISGALNPTSRKAEQHAIQYYESVRHMKTDTARISQATGIAKDKLDKIKEHVFIKEHDLIDGRKRFDPDYDMAQSWQRLINGSFKEQDMVLLKHEYAELRYMEKGLTQSEAHIKASRKYDYAKYCE
ncbi:hypothetical protein [uncultured Ruminococcus sp.]|uniref:hypothetical protein n=1 Tax=uncultured Ruminococcus sp. TaxID=165186 RepID=UPI0025F025B5|nr:hypothetical protein [uncultured Ruminococcus sp.]